MLGRSGDTGAGVGDRESLLRALAQSDVLMIAAMQSEGIDASKVTKEQLLAEIEKAARDLDNRKHFEPLMYEKDGVRRLPLFTSSEHAQHFAAEYSKERQRMYPFQMMTVKSSVLAEFALAAEAVVVVNDGDVESFELSRGEVEELAEAGK